jgi:tRNA pseudouridine55 synthase
LARKQTYRLRYTNQLIESGERQEPQPRKERIPIDPQIQQTYLEGQVLLIDKPLHWTSFDMVRKLRSMLQIKKIGHAGTLDPLATGLLIICTGKFTKRINEFMAQEKEYTGSFTIGATTPTYDLESAPTNFKDYSTVSTKMIKNATLHFIGEIGQKPPMYSAIKKDGVALYELARRGEEVELKTRKVIISIFEITSIELPVVYFRVVCSTGTYIRSLANDFGDVLGCGAYLSELRRTKIGGFSVQDATSLETLENSLIVKMDS